MSQPRIVSEEPLNIYEVAEAIAESAANRKEELNFRAQRTKEYVESVQQMNLKQAKAAKKKISELEIPRFKDEYIAKIIDVNPVSVDDLKQLVASFNVTVKEDYLKQIISILQE